MAAAGQFGDGSKLPSLDASFCRSSLMVNTVFASSTPEGLHMSCPPRGMTYISNAYRATATHLWASSSIAAIWLRALSLGERRDWSKGPTKWQRSTPTAT